MSLILKIKIFCNSGFENLLKEQMIFKLYFSYRSLHLMRKISLEKYLQIELSLFYNFAGKLA